MTRTMECITDWMLRQRWYAGKGRVPQLVEVSRVEWACDEPGVSIRVLLLRDMANVPPSLYHVPIVVRPTIPRGAGRSLIGRDEHDDYLFDAPYDPAYVPALLRELGAPSVDSTGAPLEGRVHSGEQSNTSIIVGEHGGQPLMVKLFRLVQPGENPDVVLQSALSAAGSRAVPRVMGAIRATWSDPLDPRAAADGHAPVPRTGHLAVAQEFVRDARDGWSIALEAARAGESFAADARALGLLLAEVHETLARHMPSREPSLGDVVGAVAGWHQRLAVASADAPALRALRPFIDAVYDAAHEEPWPPLQRIHGDAHLGQALRRPDGGWVLVDFEGEPLRPLEDRTRLDSPVRDIAGVVRSFDYARGTVLAELVESAGLRAAEQRLDEWAREAREAFLEGYSAGSGLDLSAHRALLDAFELDKAVYEAMYEARNRPTWLPIPLAAVERLVAPERAHQR